jgi:hypothetical protein
MCCHAWWASSKGGKDIASKKLRLVTTKSAGREPSNRRGEGEREREGKPPTGGDPAPSIAPKLQITAVIEAAPR